MAKFLLFLLLLTPLGSAAEKPLSIYVICYYNGVGLSRDLNILIEELTKLGHDAQFLFINDASPKPKVDVNLFIDLVNEDLFEYADKNYLIPNPEHCFTPPEILARFDKILCKTKEAVRIYQPINPNTEFMSFTSYDRYDEGVKKNYKSPLHLQGGSVQKGSRSVGAVWLENPILPGLLFLKHGDNHQRHGCDYQYPPAHNIKIVTRYLWDAELREIQNLYGMHICPSETEGFGHYLFEALSCACVVVTTDAPPMNEFVSDPRCLVRHHQTSPYQLATRYHIEPQHLDLVVMNLLSLSEEELKVIGQKNREFFLENDRFFKQRLAEIFPPKEETIAE